MIRFRTGDITTLYKDKCGCGRNFIKMKKVLKRTDDLIIVNGAKLYPDQIEELITNIEPEINNFQIITNRDATGDKMEIRLEIISGKNFDEIRSLQKITEGVRHSVKDFFDIDAQVRFVEKNSFEAKNHKIRRYIDNREY